MERRRLLMLIALALAGYGALALLSPRFNPTARWGFRLDRSEAIARARAEARLSGLDASRWRAVVTSTYQEQTGYFFTHHPDSARKAMLSPVLIRVLLAEPDGGRRQWRVSFTGDGKLDSFSLKEPSAQSRKPEGIPIERTREKATAALARLVGGEAAQFSLVSELDKGDEGVRYFWERSIPGEEDFKLQVNSIVQGETVRELGLITYFSPRYTDIYTNRRSATRWLDLFEVFLIVLLIITVGAFYLFFWIRGEINHRLALILFILTLLAGLARAVFRGELDSQLAGAFEFGSGNYTALNASLGLLLPVVFITLMITMFWVTGHALTRRAGLHSAATFVALLRGKLRSRLVASRLATGLLLGGVLAAVPVLVMASGLFPNLQLDAPEPSLFVSRAPLVAAVLQYISPALWVAYGFLLPLFSVYVRQPRLVRALTLLLGGALLLEDTTYQSSLGGTVAIVTLLILVADWIFRRYDFLTLMTASFAADGAHTAWSFIVQPSDAHRAIGWRALAVLAVVLAVALAIAFIGSWQGREEEAASGVEDEDERAAGTALQRAERERLMAEFGVARLAQQHMLPDVPPVISGYEISGTCRPAREVGGDLYDFLVLPSERIGIVVADVSGKGVPAALYMTLTMGLLASVAETESDPAAILREVNRHLYEVCRRKVFVTMLLGVLDPATHTFTYARAGHNPGVWRRTSEQASTWLRAAGMGLGLSSSKLFNRSLHSESIKIERGDAVLLYSDGITEAMNVAGEEYGEERLLEAVARTDGLGASETQEAILADVGAFLGETSPQDDITLVVVRVSEG